MFTSFRPYLHNCASRVVHRDNRAAERGFTFMELLVSSALGLVVLMLSLSTTEVTRRLFKSDIVRTRINQNIRSAIDILGLNVRQAGEAFTASFPAILVINGATTDELVVRRNLYQNEILNVCQTLQAGSSNASVLFAYNTVNIACAYNVGLVPYLTTWTNYAASQGGQAKAYVYNRTTKQGEFFTFTGGTNTGTQMSISKSAGAWSYSYPNDGNTAAMYIIEQLRFRVLNNVLQIIKNEDYTNALNIVDGITGFDINVRMQDGTSKSNFTESDSWALIKSLEITVTGTDSFAKKKISSVVTTRLFPRNILSQ